ncbi:MAG: toxin-antitoxin system YwqK family antitoxin [Flavobacteriales bacterium]|nr:toxin-antitoxin system YwqK family antitoxin [Flavobacteriales bacterium]
MTLFKGVIICLIAISSFVGFGQNALDADGKKTGYWQFTGAMKNDKTYAADEIVEEGNFDRSRKEGLWKKYYPGGKLKSEIEYANGKATGKFTTYFPNGNVEEKGNWKGGKYTGEYEMYYPNGQIRQKKTFNESGATEGKVTMWYENGKKEIEFSTVNGQEDGEAVWFYENGDVKKKQNFTGGVMDAPAEEFAMKNPAYVDPNKKPAKKGPKIAGKFNGSSGLVDCYGKTYDDDKNILMDGCFQDGRLFNGRHYIYDEYGLLDHIEVYENGEYVGNGVIGAKDKY